MKQTRRGIEAILSIMTLVGFAADSVVAAQTPVRSLSSGSYLNQVTDQILSESSVAYQSEMQLLQEKLDKESFEEEVFVRGGVFKRQIPLL